MLEALPFNGHVAEYEAWFDEHPFVFQSEVLALKEQLPKGEGLRGLEVATGTGRFAEALGIRQGLEPAENMRKEAIKRGIEVLNGEAEHLPYPDLSFDFVVMSFCISVFESVRMAFKEAYRVLRPGGSLIVGFLDKDSIIGQEYEVHRPDSVFYQQSTFYPPDKVIFELKGSGFQNFTISQTLFGHLDEIKELQMPKPDFGEGSFVVIKAIKK